MKDIRYDFVEQFVIGKLEIKEENSEFELNGKIQI